MKINKRNIWRFIRILFIFAIGLVILYELPAHHIEIEKSKEKLGGFQVLGLAADLIIQESTEKGIWASRGYSIYFKSYNKDYFERIGRVPVPFGKAFVLSSRIVRNIMNKQEVLDLLVRDQSSMIAFGGGWIYRSLDNCKSFNKVYPIENYGFGIGRGVMPQGYTNYENGWIYWGEYFRNPERNAVHLYLSKDNGKTYETIFEFNKGDIHHIHAVQYDKYKSALWMATGDLNSGSNIMYSIDGGCTFTKIGSGSQKWRTVSLLFTEQYVYWGMDGSSNEYPKPLICRWNRETGENEELNELDSFAFYSAKTSNGVFFISTDGTNGSACLWYSEHGDEWDRAFCFDRKRKNHFGTIRMKSHENMLVISTINLSPYNNSLLLLRAEK